MRFEVDAQSQWDLLSTILPLLLGALSSVRHTQHTRRYVPMIQGELGLLRLQLFQEEHLQHELGEQAFESVLEAFDYLFTTLETLISDDILQRSTTLKHTFKPSDHPKLNLLRNLLRLTYSDTDVADGTSLPSLLPYISLGRSSGQLIAVQQAVLFFNKAVGEAFTDTLDKADAAEPAQSVVLTDREIDDLRRVEDFSNTASHLFHRLATGVSNCPADSDLHTVRLRLGIFDNLRWDLLVSACSTHGVAGRWQPVVCTHQRLTLKSSQSTIHPHTSFCDRIVHAVRRRDIVHLIFNNDNFWSGGSCGHTEFTSQSAAKALAVSFRDLVKGNHSQESEPKVLPRLESQDKKTIIATLARSLLFFYNSPWLRGINDGDVQFICKATDTDFAEWKGPYISTHLNDLLQETEPDTEPLHSRLFIIKFGILILELESNSKLELHEDDCDFETNQPSKFLMLKRSLDDVRRRVGVGYQAIVEACLNFDELMNALHHPKLDDHLRCRAVILKHILTPLVAELRHRFPEAAEGFLEIPHYPMGPPHQVQSATDRVTMFDTHAQRVRMQKRDIEEGKGASPEPHRIFHSPRTLPPLSLEAPIRDSAQPGIANDQLVLFEEDTIPVDPTDEKCKRYKKFIQHFTLFLKHQVKPENACRRVKIAILDTGIDEDDEVLDYLRQKAITIRKQKGNSEQDPIQEQNKKSFVSGDCHDSHGHGTHIATLLMRFAPAADLYIAKIAESSTVDTADHISDAIDWAVAKGVNIITMSFGISETPTGAASLIKIGKSISVANSKNVLLFAAASNGAGHGSRTYPASDGHVICVHAVDGLGYDDGGLNPPTGAYKDRLSTLGVGMEFSWKGERVYKSGTSYATPVLAAISANILEYAAYASENRMLSEWKFHRLHSKDGMERMLEFISNRMGVHDFVVPWKLWTEGTTDSYICDKLNFEL